MCYRKYSFECRGSAGKQIISFTHGYYKIELLFCLKKQRLLKDPMNWTIKTNTTYPINFTP